MENESNLDLSQLVAAVQYELQAAVDFIASTDQEPSETGKAPTALGVTSIRVRVPFALNIEQETSTRSRTADLSSVLPSEPAAVRAAFATRKGFALPIAEGKKAVFTRIKATPMPSYRAETDSQPTETESGARVGEIELFFEPYRR